jgi:hypothetical protein
MASDEFDEIEQLEDFDDIDEEMLQDLDEEELLDDDVDLEDLEDEELITQTDETLEDLADNSEGPVNLDVIIKERLETSEQEEEQEVESSDEDDLLEDDPIDSVGKVVPKREDEFTCTSCFLVKKLSQLADKEHMICRDCL